MRVISKRPLREFWRTHADAEKSLRAWWKTAVKADWGNIGEVRKSFAHADGVKLADNSAVTVFNIGGNKYRLIVRIVYPIRLIYVLLVLTHREYDGEDWKMNLCRE